MWYEQIKQCPLFMNRSKIWKPGVGSVDMIWSIWGQWAAHYKCVTIHPHRAYTCFIGCFKDKKHSGWTYTELGNLTHSWLPIIEIPESHLFNQNTSPRLHIHMGTFWVILQNALFIKATLLLCLCHLASCFCMLCFFLKKNIYFIQTFQYFLCSEPKYPHYATIMSIVVLSLYKRTHKHTRIYF